MNKMNKKAAMFHWIIFGIVGAIALFFILTAKVNVGMEAKGTWQLTFLKENYLPAEKEAIKLNVQARELGRELAQELAINGGFKTGPDCGVVDGIPLWNFQERWCVPDPEKGIKELFLEKKRVGKAPIELQDIEEVGIQGSLFFGQGVPKTISSRVGTYTYNTAFSISLGYTFDEYQEVEKEAGALVAGCRSRKDLKNCIAEKKPERWMAGLCDDQPREGSKRTLPFCRASSFPPVRYQLGLDFVPTKPFVVESFAVKPVEQGYEFRWEQDPAAERYVLYYTNWPGAKNRKGAVDEVFETGLSLTTLGYFREKVSLENPAAVNCPTEKKVGVAYLCAEEKVMVVYLFKDDRIKPGEAYGTVTAVKGEQESAIDHFELLPPPISPTS